MYQLLDDARVAYVIKGVADLRAALSEVVGTTTQGKFFLYDEDPLYSKRESELIQPYLQQHGHMPPGEGEDDLDDSY